MMSARCQAQNATNFYMKRYRIHSPIIRSMCFESSFAAAEYASEQAALARSKKIAWKLATEAATSAGEVALHDPHTTDFVSTAKDSAVETVQIAAPAIAHATCEPAARKEALRVASRIALIHFKQHKIAREAVQKSKAKEAAQKAAETREKALVMNEEAQCKAKLGSSLNNAVQHATETKVSVKSYGAGLKVEDRVERRFLVAIQNSQEEAQEQEMISMQDEQHISKIRKQEVITKMKMSEKELIAEKSPSEAEWTIVKAVAADAKTLAKEIAGWEQGRAIPESKATHAWTLWSENITKGRKHVPQEVVAVHHCQVASVPWAKAASSAYKAATAAAKMDCQALGFMQVPQLHPSKEILGIVDSTQQEFDKARETVIYYRQQVRYYARRTRWWRQRSKESHALLSLRNTTRTCRDYRHAYRGLDQRFQLTQAMKGRAHEEMLKMRRQTANQNMTTFQNEFTLKTEMFQKWTKRVKVLKTQAEQNPTVTHIQKLAEAVSESKKVAVTLKKDKRVLAQASAAESKAKQTMAQDQCRENEHQVTQLSMAKDMHELALQWYSCAKQKRSICESNMMQFSGKKKTTDNHFAAAFCKGKQRELHLKVVKAQKALDGSNNDNMKQAEHMLATVNETYQNQKIQCGHMKKGSLIDHVHDMQRASTDLQQAKSACRASKAEIAKQGSSMLSTRKAAEAQERANVEAVINQTQVSIQVLKKAKQHTFRAQDQLSLTNAQRTESEKSQKVYGIAVANKKRAQSDLKKALAQKTSMLAIRAAAVRKQAALLAYWKVGDKLQATEDKLYELEHNSTYDQEKKLFLRCMTVKPKADLAGRQDYIAEDELWAAKTKAKREPSSDALELLRSAAIRVKTARSKLADMRLQMQRDASREIGMKIQGKNNDDALLSTGQKAVLLSKHLSKAAGAWLDSSSRLFSVLENKKSLFDKAKSSPTSGLQAAGQQIKCAGAASDRAMARSKHHSKHLSELQGGTSLREQARELATKQFQSTHMSAKELVSKHKLRKLRANKRRHIQMACIDLKAATISLQKDEKQSSREFSQSKEAFDAHLTKARASLLQVGPNELCSDQQMIFAQKQAELAKELLIAAQKWQGHAAAASEAMTDQTVQCLPAPSLDSLDDLRVAVDNSRNAKIAVATGLTAVQKTQAAIQRFKASELACKARMGGGELAFKKDQEISHKQAEQSQKKEAKNKETAYKKQQELKVKASCNVMERRVKNAKDLHDTKELILSQLVETATEYVTNGTLQRAKKAQKKVHEEARQAITAEHETKMMANSAHQNAQQDSSTKNKERVLEARQETLTHLSSTLLAP